MPINLRDLLSDALVNGKIRAYDVSDPPSDELLHAEQLNALEPIVEAYRLGMPMGPHTRDRLQRRDHHRCRHDYRWDQGYHLNRCVYCDLTTTAIGAHVGPDFQPDCCCDAFQRDGGQGPCRGCPTHGAKRRVPWSPLCICGHPKDHHSGTRYHTPLSEGRTTELPCHYGECRCDGFISLVTLHYDPQCQCGHTRDEHGVLADGTTVRHPCGVGVCRCQTFALAGRVTE